VTYSDCAPFSDELMADVPYDLWIDFLYKKIEEFMTKKDGWSLLDLGCGTGTLAVALKERGIEVTGVDLSANMLSIAQKKAFEKGLSIPLFEKSMSDLSGLGKFDIVIIFCDSLNYLLSEQEVIKTFKEVYDHLEDDGLLLFDTHSEKKINEIFIGNTFGSNDERISFIWGCFPGEWENSVEHDLSFFVKEGNIYKRFDESHLQRTFPISMYVKWLTNVGFSVQDVNGDFFEKNNEKSWERAFFTAQKLKKF
jgi:2-polyprenyl-3-methyl-5-hydroxy-6-metoxy-1,4-benzoquinol methylase